MLKLGKGNNKQLSREEKYFIKTKMNEERDI